MYHGVWQHVRLYNGQECSSVSLPNNLHVAQSRGMGRVDDPEDPDWLPWGMTAMMLNWYKIRRTYHGKV